MYIIIHKVNILEVVLRDLVSTLKTPSRAGIAKQIQILTLSSEVGLTDLLENWTHAEKHQKKNW